MASLRQARRPQQHHAHPLPAKCPELNPQENIWQFIRDNWLSNRVFKSYDDIVDHCCDAWNKLIDQPWKIMSIGHARLGLPVLISEVLVLYIRPLRQVFCSLSWLPSASSVPWFSSASAAWPSAPSSGACRSFPCGRRSVLNAGSDLQPICLALNHPARLLTIRSFSQRTVYFLLPPIGLSRPMPTGLQNGSPASKAAKAARRVCGPRRCVPVWLRSA